MILEINFNFIQSHQLSKSQLQIVTQQVFSLSFKKRLTTTVRRVERIAIFASEANVKVLKTVTVWVQVYTCRSANWSMILQSSLLLFYITSISWRFESHQVILWSHFFYHRDHIVWLISLSSIDLFSSVDSINFRWDHVILVISELSYSRIVDDPLNLIRRTR
jgi:hypothetical protein